MVRSLPNCSYSMRSLLLHLLRLLGIIAAVVVALIALAIGAFLYLVPDACGNEVLSEVMSPGGRLKAVVFERDCGATTGFSTQVSILPVVEALPNEAGNVLVADCDHGKAPSGPGGGPALRVTWLSDRQMRIEHHPGARIVRSEAKHGGIKIEYAHAALPD